jgi:hypothetical protein
MYCIINLLMFQNLDTLSIIIFLSFNIATGGKNTHLCKFPSHILVNCHEVNVKSIYFYNLCMFLFHKYCVVVWATLFNCRENQWHPDHRQKNAAIFYLLACMYARTDLPVTPKNTFSLPYLFTVARPTHHESNFKRFSKIRPCCSFLK